MENDAPASMGSIDFSKDFKQAPIVVLILFLISLIFLSIYIGLIRRNDTKLVIEELNLAIMALFGMDMVGRLIWAGIALFWAVILMLSTHIIHEVIHGIVYWRITKKRPKFGMGAQGIHVKVPANTPMKSRDYMYALLAPIVAISIIGLAILIAVDVRLMLPMMFIISFNAATSLADVYVAVKLPKNSEVTDTGDVVQYTIQNS